MAVTMKITNFSDITSCSVVVRYQCFGGTCCFYLQDWPWNVGAILHSVTFQKTGGDGEQAKYSMA
jgi:hypothetical protein